MPRQALIVGVEGPPCLVGEMSTIPTRHATCGRSDFCIRVELTLCYSFDEHLSTRQGGGCCDTGGTNEENRIHDVCGHCRGLRADDDC